MNTLYLQINGRKQIRVRRNYIQYSRLQGQYSGSQHSWQTYRDDNVHARTSRSVAVKRVGTCLQCTHLASWFMLCSLCAVYLAVPIRIYQLKNNLLFFSLYFLFYYQDACRVHLRDAEIYTTCQGPCNSDKRVIFTPHKSWYTL